MDTTKNSMKQGEIIKVLSVVALVAFVVALVATAISRLGFMYYDWFYPLIFFAIDLFCLLPMGLWALYVLVLNQKLKATVLVPVTFGLLPITLSLGHVFRTEFYTEFTVLLSRLLILMVLPMLVLCILGVINLLHGLNKKTFVIIVLSAFLLWEALKLLALLLSLGYGNYLMLALDFANVLGETALCVSMLLFVLNNRIPAIIKVSPEKERAMLIAKASVTPMSAEQALRLLQDKLELGIITQEEYTAQRTEIINSL